MRLSRLLLVVALVLPLLVQPAAASEDSDLVSVPSPVRVASGSTGGPEPVEPCEGDTPGACVRSFVVTGNFNIYVAAATNYFGYVVVRGDTPTGSVAIDCEQTFAELQCVYEHAGFFMEGQVFTMKVVSPGLGYWRVRVA
ncbi:MAG TPA: hypothetical protein VNE62_11750 [Actinomycetota bacterium]|nr:hypothetical protein [Actinomycetota bacterium]